MRYRIYDIDSLQWLAENYIKMNGLRNWTWKTIIKGIISEHIKTIKMDIHCDIDANQVEFIWLSFLKVAGIYDLS